jgi:hypothetical protein
MTVKQSFDLNGLAVGVEVTETEMRLTFEGHGDFNSPGGAPIILEREGDSVMVCIYSDINSPFPLHKVSLENALETAFIKSEEASA